MSSSNQSSIVTKCTRVLDILADARTPLTFTEIVAQSGYVKSSTHRILSILQGERLVEFSDRSKTYRLGPKLIAWALSAWRGTDLQQIAAGELEDLGEGTGYNVALAIMDENSALYLRTIDHFPVRYAAKVGEHSPLHCTAVGKALLAFQPEGQRAELISQLKFERFTDYTLTDASALEIDLANVRVRGYSLSDREEFLQICGIAAPIRDSQGHIAAAVSLWTPIEQADIKSLSKCSLALLGATARISARLGYQAY